MLEAIQAMLGAMPSSSGLLIVLGLVLYVVSTLRSRRIHKD